jgi:type IV pilus assembly protein PilE
MGTAGHTVLVFLNVGPHRWLEPVRRNTFDDTRHRRNEMKKHNGFTLLELMISISIVGITTAIALPSYRESVLKSNRSDAQISIAGLATLQERFYFTHNRYTGDFADLIDGAESEEPIASEKGHYSIALAVTANGREWTMEATAINKQAEDHNCAKMSVTSKGKKTSHDSANALSTDCWK